MLSVTDELSAKSRTLLQTTDVNVDFTISFEELSLAMSTVVTLDAAIADGYLQTQLVAEGLSALTSIQPLRAVSVTSRSSPPSPLAVPRAPLAQSPRSAALALDTDVLILVSASSLVVLVACGIGFRRRASRVCTLQDVETPPLPIVV